MSAGRQSVFLTGFMAVGKSTVGRLLAHRLGVAFFDLDALVEADANMTVAEIFAREGEASFREREARALKMAIHHGGGVVALGGGALLGDESRVRIVRAHGRLVCLTASIDALVARLGDATLRPLLAGSPDRRAAVAALLRERAALYEDADLAVDTTDRAPERVAEEIATWIASA